jgi:hypothetical protein
LGSIRTVPAEERLYLASYLYLKAGNSIDKGKVWLSNQFGISQASAVNYLEAAKKALDSGIEL